MSVPAVTVTLAVTLQLLAPVEVEHGAADAESDPATSSVAAAPVTAIVAPSRRAHFARRVIFLNIGRSLIHLTIRASSDCTPN